MIRKLFVVCSLLAVFASLAACSGNSGNSLSPTTTTAQPDPVSVQSPAQSSVQIVQVSPGTPATLNYKTNDVSVHAKYVISQSDRDEAVRTGSTIYTTACLSVDGNVGVPICFSQPASGLHGDNYLLLHVNLQFNPELTKTNYVICNLSLVHNNGLPGRTERVITKAVAPGQFSWH